MTKGAKTSDYVKSYPFKCLLKAALKPYDTGDRQFLNCVDLPGHRNHPVALPHYQSVTPTLSKTQQYIIINTSHRTLAIHEKVDMVFNDHFNVEHTNRAPPAAPASSWVTASTRDVASPIYIESNGFAKGVMMLTGEIVCFVAKPKDNSNHALQQITAFQSFDPTVVTEGYQWEGVSISENNAL